MSNNQICGYISLLYSIADKPLNSWSKCISLGGKIRRVTDDELNGDKVIEIIGPHNYATTTNIFTPAKVSDILDIKLPILILIIKNLNLHFKLEIQIIDKTHYRRRFSFMTYNLEKLPSIGSNITHIPLKLEECWNLLEINLQTLCCKAYATDYEALQRIIIYPNCRLRRIYLQDRHYNKNEFPAEIYQAFLDLYLLKYKNFIEKACQTEERYTGIFRQCNLNNFAIHNMITALSKNKFIKNAKDIKNCDTLDTMVNLCNLNILKRDHMLPDILNSNIKIHNQNVIEQDQCYIQSLVNEEKLKNSSDIKEEKMKTIKIHKAENKNSPINIDIMNYKLQPATSVQIQKVQRSPFLQTYVNKTLFKNNRSSMYPCSQKIQNSGDTHVISKNYTLRNGYNNIQIKKNNKDSGIHIF